MSGGFADLFGRSPAAVASAPGRVNLIGEHTDYNAGFVLPVAIPQRTSAELAPRSDLRVRAASVDIGGGVEEYVLGAETPGRGWLDYLQGLTRTLAADGVALSGFDLRLGSQVPIGAGLGSSAAFEVAVLRALRQAFGLRLDDLEIARVGQRAENEFVGARVGIMDQMAASLADAESALFIDARTLAHRRVPLPAAAELLVVDSGIPHSNVAGHYNTRRGECERSCTLLGVESLRDVSTADSMRLEALPDPLGRRARHVVEENGRVLAAVEAMRACDLARLGTLLDASHASLRDDFEVSTPEIDLLVAIAREEPDVFGARLTGGGFGGAVVALARTGTAAAAGERIADRYAERSGRRATVLVPARTNLGKT